MSLSTSLRKKFKKEFKIFFTKHPEVKKLPWVMTVITPKYEYKGSRHVSYFDTLMENEEYYKKYVDTTIENFDYFYDKVYHDIPEITLKDAFYLFDENTFVIVSFRNEKVIFEEIDYSNEIWNMY